METELIKIPPVNNGGTYEIHKGKAKLVREPNEAVGTGRDLSTGHDPSPQQIKPKTKEN